MSALPATAYRPAAHTAERRRHSRVSVALLGRYMLSNRMEYPCQTENISPGGVLLTAPVPGLLGERVIVYLEHLGRIEGVVTRLLRNGFATSISATPRKRDKLASQLTWLANRQALGLPEDRRHERVTPTRPSVVIRLDNGREVSARLIDVSMSGAAINMEHQPPIGAALTIGTTNARVVRHFPGGVAVEFRLPLSPDRFDENIVL